MFIFSLIQSHNFKEYKNFWCIKLKGIILGLSLIPLMFYTYNGAFGKSPDWLNIAIFYLSAGVVFLFEHWAFQNIRRPSRLTFVVLCLIGILFVVFTFAPPHLPLFQDPVTVIYGTEH